MNPQAQHHLDELKKQLNQLESHIITAKNDLEKLEREYLRPDYTQIEGIVGKYDGNNMVTDDGQKYEVPSNYAAKSKLVFGDTLKLIEEDGKKLFKQIERVDREKVEGIMTKKEGEWYLLTDRGSYKVLDTAAEYQGAVMNCQATAFVPKNKLEAPFATIEHIEGNIKQVVEPEQEKKATQPVVAEKKIEHPAPTPKREDKPRENRDRRPAGPPKKKKSFSKDSPRENKPEKVEEKTYVPHEVNLDADDLV